MFAFEMNAVRTTLFYNRRSILRIVLSQDNNVAYFFLAKITQGNACVVILFRARAKKNCWKLHFKSRSPTSEVSHCHFSFLPLQTLSKLSPQKIRPFA